ncbi:MAG TPA: MFS transporter [Gaiellaceae bacterium]|nr:MFS transporter [Gaiellaceae bacterium]
MALRVTRSGKRELPDRWAYALAGSVIGLGLFASATPSPLYRSYSLLFHFSPLTLTLIYATYAFGVLASLLLLGGASDDVGRRPVLLVSLGALMGSTVLFMLADSTAWLFVARGVQGLATGAAVSAASASLLDFHPRRDPAGVGLTNATASAAGLGLGTLVSSVIVALGTAPRVLPYAVLLGLFAIAFAGAYLMPEPVTERKAFSLTLERPSLPKAVHRPFVLAGLAVLSSWSIGALFFSLGPELADELFSTTNAVASGAGIVALAGSAVVAQLLTVRFPPWIGAAAGSLALAAGILVIVGSAATGSGALFVAGSILGGAGFGAAFLGGLRALVVAIPAGHRASVMSAFYIVAYASLSIPAVLAGLVATHLGLEKTFELFGVVVAVLAFAVAFEATRTRPRAAAQPALSPARSS